LHIGDSHVSDVIKPIDNGWRAMYFPIAIAEASNRERMLVQLIDAFHQLGLDVSEFAKA
jgi:hypothetical protein